MDMVATRIIYYGTPHLCFILEHLFFRWWQPLSCLLVKLDGKTDREVVGNLRKHDIVSYSTYSHIHKLQTRSHRLRNHRIPNTMDLISFPCFCTPQQLLSTAASSRNRAIRHGWKSNNIVRKVDGNQTNLDWIQTKHRKQQSLNFHTLPMMHALFLWELENLLNDINFDTSLSQAIHLC